MEVSVNLHDSYSPDMQEHDGLRVLTEERCHRHQSLPQV